MMERLGGFLLCRRLLLDWLPPFLSLADILRQRWLAGWRGARSQREGKKYLPQELTGGERQGSSGRRGLTSVSPLCHSPCC